jgi:hypothetical protein
MGRPIHNSEQRYDLNTLLAQGWRPVRERLMPYHYFKEEQGWKSYLYILILLEREKDGPSIGQSTQS